MLLEVKLNSKELKKNTQVNIIIPNTDSAERPYKTMWLLHGLTDDHTAWLRHTRIEDYATEHNLAVVMPNVDRSWYTDSAYNVNYFSFVSKELPELYYYYFKGMSEKREDNIVAGLSMGGYGALKLALSCPDQYGSCIALSGALDITRKGLSCNLSEWRSIFGYEIKSPLDLAGSSHDVFALSENNRREGRSFPKLYMWCGREDSLITINREFDKHLSGLGVAHTFEESEGDHTWKWWDSHIEKAIKFVLDV